jgi:predicted Zn finger-like uncharacterized protein
MINMNCLECGHAFELSESKIPSPTFNVKCPACRKVFQVTVENVAPPPPDPQKAVWEQFRPQMESLVKAQLDNVRKDVLSSLGLMASPQPPGMTGFNPTGPVEKRALVCESDPGVAQHIVSGLQSLGYSVQVSSLLSEALQRLEGGFFDVITTEFSFSDDSEGGQKLLNKVNSRKLDERRKMFLAVISRSVKTLGPEAAFFLGANVFINKSDLHNLENLIQDGLRHYAGIYGNYFEVLTESAERL